MKARSGGIAKGEADKFLKEKMVLAPAKHKPIFEKLFKAEEFKKLPPYDNAHTYAGEWYVTIPLWGSPDFVQYIISSRELVFGIYYDKYLKIRMSPDQSTASADQENQTIWISPLPFSANFMRAGHVPANEFALMSIAAGNGTLIHEAAHFARSPKKITDMFQLIPHIGSREAMKDSSAAYSIANLAEDIYVEDWLANEHPKYLPFLIASHHLYFNDATLVERVSSLYNEIEIVAEAEEETQYRIPVSRLLDLLIATKNWRYDEQLWGGVILKYYKRFMQVKGMLETKKRARLIFEIWTEMREDHAIRWDDGTAESAMVVVVTGDADFDKHSIDKTCIKEGKEALDEISSRKITIDDSMAAEIEKELEKAALVILVKEGKTDISKIPPMKVQDAIKDTSQLEPDTRFKGLGRLLRQTFTHNYTPGQPQRRGQVLVNTRLYRIATDNKIFTYRERRKATGKDYEIAVLVDCSGSMSGGKITEAMKVGVAAYGSLRRARVRTSLLGHTSTRGGLGSEGMEYPLLYVIGLPKDPISVVLRRANSFIEGTHGLHNNYDGFAILESAKYFSDKPTKKWMFVISDGYPSGKNYGGAEANIHTSQCVKKVRDKGIDVVSITIEEGVYETNDIIYGPKKNIKTNSSRVLKQLIEAMFTTKEGVVDG